MSYILEALRKSQQERELGQVPTLETPTFPAGEAGARPSIWIPLAVFLAALAVVIALYSALRGGIRAPAAADEAAASAAMEVPRDSARAPKPPEKPSAPPGSYLPATTAASSPPPPTGSSSAPERIDPGPASPTVVMEAPAAPAEPRQPVPEPPIEPRPSAPPKSDKTDKVPPDLIADIEAFKREIRDEQAGSVGAAEDGDEAAPRDLRLPKDVRKRLPSFVMSAHIYDEDPPKRFVLINGLKTREGEESREEITVVRILPDGALLSFDGHKFFQHR